MSITQLRDYQADVRENSTEWLGELVIFSVNKTLVRHSELGDQLRAGGLEDYLPAAPKDENVWRRLYTDGVRRTIKRPTADDVDASEKILMRTLERKTNKVTKQIVIETVDVRGQRLGYEAVLEIKFDAANSGDVNVRRIGSHHTEADELVEELRDAYLLERGCIDENSVRDIVRRVLESCNSTVVRPGGGVYFCATADVERGGEYLDKIKALETASEVIPNCIVSTLPLVDTAKQRANIKRAFEMESSEVLDRLLNEMRDLVKSKTEITEARAAAFAKESKRAKRRVGQYKDVLSDSLDGVDAKIEVFDLVFAKLLNQVKA